jgi:hypothetical protein
MRSVWTHEVRPAGVRIAPRRFESISLSPPTSKRASGKARFDSAKLVSKCLFLTDNVGIPGNAAVYTMSQTENDNKLVEDLERRIEILENLDETEFGSFTRIDYIILTIGAVMAPILALILAR